MNNRQSPGKYLRDHERWRTEQTINLIPSENLTSPAVQKFLSSDLGHRYTLEVNGEIHGTVCDLAYRGSKYLDEMEREGEALARELFGSTHATLRPLSGHLSVMMMVLSTCRRGDTIMSIPVSFGGYDGYGPDYIPDILGLKYAPIPFLDNAGNIDTPALVDEIGKKRPNLVVLGASMIPFPYDLKPIAEACGDVGATLGYDGSHVLGLIAGGEFQDPLAEGADVLVGSTHKTFPGPQGGILLTNDDGIFERVKKNITWRTMDNAHWNRVGGLCQALWEMEKIGGSYAEAVVRNARSLARHLHEHGFPIRYEKQGFTRSHQVLPDVDAVFEKTGLSSPELAKVWERNDLISDALLRLGTQEITRLGMKEDDMAQVASLLKRASHGENVGDEVRSFRHRFRLSYCPKPTG